MTEQVNTMSYQSFRSTYAWMLKEYPGTSSVYSNNGFRTKTLGSVRTQRYERSSARGKWHLVEEIVDPLTGAYYANSVDAIPFFRGLGGRERVVLGYTKLGYMPTEITSTAPDKLRKAVRTFSFD